MVVLKFGGSSVATAVAIAQVSDIVSRERRPRAVVVSALGGVTDQLIELAHLAGAGGLPDAWRRLDAIRARHRVVAGAIAAPARRLALDADLEATWRDVQALAETSAAAGVCAPPTRDAIVASGELASSRIVTAFLAERGLPAVWVDARRVLVTDGRHGEAAPDLQATRGRVRAEVRARILCLEVPVVGGFVGATPEGATTTLGRGGSDYSASLIGACLEADEVQIWTDTDGVLTADPRVLPQAQTVARLSYGEAAALAYFGAKVLHPATVAPAVATLIPVRVLNARRPESAGTLITAHHGQRARPLAGIAWRTGLSLMAIELGPTAGRAAALAEVTAACARAGVTLHQASVSDTGVALLVEATPAADTVAAHAWTLGRVERHDGLASVTAVGDALTRDAELAAAVLRSIGRVPLRLVTQTPGACHLSVLVAQRRLARVLASLHGRFFERDEYRDHARIDPPDSVEPAIDGPADGREVWA